VHGDSCGTGRDAMRDGIWDGCKPAEDLDWDAGTDAAPEKTFDSRVCSGNGLDLDAEIDAMVTGVAAGTRCGLCRGMLDGEAVERIGAKWFHADACAQEIHKRNAVPVPIEPSAKPKRGRGRIKGADTTPDVEGL
jgi:hypothetical protein